MNDRLYKIRKENPNFDKKLVDMFAKTMPKLLLTLIDGDEYDKHIGSKEVALLSERYITNDKGEHIGFHWDYDSVISAVKNYIDMDDVEFYPCDIWVWANVKYGDMAHLLTNFDESKQTAIMIKYAIAELTDPDFPFYHASHRAYCWLKKHIENEEG